MTPASLIASAIRRERSRAGLSLSALAARAGVSKSTLSQLETANGNPSIETLWAIARALRVPFSFLFEVSETQPCVIRARDGTELSAEAADFTATLLAACPPGRRRDIYRAQMARPSTRHADPHPDGTVEHVMVMSGRARLGPEDATEDLGPGDYFRYPGDVPHIYEPLTESATLVIVMDAPG